MRSAATSISCPKCGAHLNGGPTRYTCDAGHGVSAADLYREVSR
jgi:transposase